MFTQSIRSRFYALPTLECLETRNLLSVSNTVTAGLQSGILQINSTGPSDSIILQQETNGLYVFSGSTVIGIYNPNSIQKVVVHLGNGQDLFDMKSSQPIPLQVFCGTGNDTVWGGAGNDTLYGGSGHDTLIENSGNNLLVAGTGNNVLYGGSGSDTLLGGSGNDILVAGSGNQLLQAGQGRDTLWGGSGNDTLKGGSGGDSIYAGRGNTQMYGGTGNDTLIGGQGNDVIHAGSGNDLLEAGTGNTTIYGGSGSDTLIGGAGNDTLIAGSGANYLYAGSGNTVLQGGSGKSILLGGSGNDTLIGGSGTDQLWGGTGNNVFIGGPTSTYFAGGPQKNQFQFGSYTSTFSVPFALSNSSNPNEMNPANPFGTGINVNQIQQGDVAGTAALIQAIKVDPASFTSRIKYTGGNNYQVELYLKGSWQWVSVTFSGNWSSHDAQPMDSKGNLSTSFWVILVQRAYLQSLNINWTLPPAQWGQGSWTSSTTAMSVLYGPWAQPLQSLIV